MSELLGVVAPLADVASPFFDIMPQLLDFLSPLFDVVVVTLKIPSMLFWRSIRTSHYYVTTSFGVFIRQSHAP